jgi:XTP/dITP diphosphohydrolase
MAVVAAPRELVIATSNPGKLREIREILADLPVVLRTLCDFPDVQMPEEGDDYGENAGLKACSVARATGLASLADDSGLEVEGLAWGPGPHSARFGGPDLDDAGRVRCLLEALRQAQGAQRRARFVCVAALATPEGALTTARGECEGRILHAPTGNAGFGYDPVFEPLELGVAVATLTPAQKHRISHRARAFRALREAIQHYASGT